MKENQSSQISELEMKGTQKDKKKEKRLLIFIAIFDLVAIVTLLIIATDFKYVLFPEFRSENEMRAFLEETNWHYSDEMDVNFIDNNMHFYKVDKTHLTYIYKIEDYRSGLFSCNRKMYTAHRKKDVIAYGYKGKEVCTRIEKSTLVDNAYSTDEMAQKTSEEKVENRSVDSTFSGAKSELPDLYYEIFVKYVSLINNTSASFDIVLRDVQNTKYTVSYTRPTAEEFGMIEVYDDSKFYTYMIFYPNNIGIETITSVSYGAKGVGEVTADDNAHVTAVEYSCLDGSRTYVNSLSDLEQYAKQLLSK